MRTPRCPKCKTIMYRVVTYDERVIYKCGGCGYDLVATKLGGRNEH